MKVCNKCKIEKTLDCFSKSTKEKDGLQYRCKDCEKEAGKLRRLNNPEKERIRHAKYHEKNKEKINKRSIQWQKDNPEKSREKSRRFYKNNKDKEKLRMKKWRDENPEWRSEYAKKFREENAEYFRLYEYQYFIKNRPKQYAKNAKYRALKKNAFVSWADRKKILEIYAECVRKTEETGIQHHVDHIIPLTHRLVCGLHVEHNLQILTATENSRKNNKFQPQ